MYGELVWERVFDTAKWGNGVKSTPIQCSNNPDHARAGARVGQLSVILPAKVSPDFTWTCFGECLVSKRVREAFLKANFKGVEYKPVLIHKKRATKIPIEDLELELWEVAVIGEKARTAQQSEIRLLQSCNACGLKRFSSFQKGLEIESNTWNGGDFFRIEEFPAFIFVSEHVKEIIVSNEFSNCFLIPSKQLVWPAILPRPEMRFASNQSVE